MAGWLSVIGPAVLSFFLASICFRMSRSAPLRASFFATTAADGAFLPCVAAPCGESRLAARCSPTRSDVYLTAARSSSRYTLAGPSSHEKSVMFAPLSGRFVGLPVGGDCWRCTECCCCSGDGPGCCFLIGTGCVPLRLPSLTVGTRSVATISPSTSDMPDLGSLIEVGARTSSSGSVAVSPSKVIWLPMESRLYCFSSTNLVSWNDILRRGLASPVQHIVRVSK